MLDHDKIVETVTAESGETHPEFVREFVGDMDKFLHVLDMMEDDDPAKVTLEMRANIIYYLYHHHAVVHGLALYDSINTHNLLVDMYYDTLG